MNKKCYIITAYIEDIDKESSLVFFEGIKKEMGAAFVVCADGGYEIAKKFDLKIDLIVGDFDSYVGVLPDEDERRAMGIELFRVNAVKDDTDTGLCIKLALDRGYRDIIIVGGIGGRLSHTLANLQLLADTAAKTDSILMMDPIRTVRTVCGPAAVKFSRKAFMTSAADKCFLSVFSHGDTAKGVSIDGAFYTLDNAVLSNLFPLGVSNEFVSESIEVTVDQGILHIIVE